MRHPLTLAIVSSLTAISFLWVLSLSHPDYHRKAEYKTTKPAYLAYYNFSGKTTYRVAADSSPADSSFTNKALDRLKDKRNSLARDTTEAHGKSKQFQLQSIRNLFDQADSYVWEGIVDGSEKHRPWIANQPWKINPFWNPNQNRPTNLWAENLQIETKERKKNDYPNAIIESLAESMAGDLPPKPRFQKRDKIRPIKGFCFHLAVLDQENSTHNITKNTTEDHSSSEIPFSSDNDREDPYPENSLQHLGTIMKRVGFRRPTIASSGIKPAEINNQSSRFEEIPQILGTSLAHQGCRLILKISQWLPLSEQFQCEWEGFTNDWETILCPGKLESLHLEYGGERFPIDAIDDAPTPGLFLPEFEPVGSKMDDLFGGNSPLNWGDRTGESFEDLQTAVSESFATTKQTAITALSGVRFEKNSGLSDQPQFLPLDGSLAGLENNRFEKLGSHNHFASASNSLKNAASYRWMELAMEEQKWVNPEWQSPFEGKSALAQNPTFEAIQLPLVDFGKHWFGQVQQAWSVKGTWWAEQKSTNDRVVLGQEMGQKR